MIEGEIRDRFAYVELVLPGRVSDFPIKFIIDTGFDGDLALPSDIASRLNSGAANSRSLMLANGDVVEIDAYEIELEWNEEPRLTEVLVTDGNPLLGIELLAGCQLSADFIPNGNVFVEEISM